MKKKTTTTYCPYYMLKQGDGMALFVVASVCSHSKSYQYCVSHFSHLFQEIVKRAYVLQLIACKFEIQEK